MRAEDHQHKVRFRRGWYPTAIRVLAWVCCVGLFIALVWVLKPPPVRTTHPDLKRIGELTGLEFPAQVWLLESEMIQRHGFHLRAQVKVRRTGLPTFLRSVPQSLSESRTEWPWLGRYIDSKPGSLFEGSESWPSVSSGDSFVTYSGAASHDGRGAQVTIFITLNEPRITRIWVDWDSRVPASPPSP